MHTEFGGSLTGTQPHGRPRRQENSIEMFLGEKGCEDETRTSDSAVPNIEFCYKSIT
jgi:hypothetical protein